MSNVSFKSLAKDKTISRSDIYGIPLDLINLEEGFNPRVETPELAQHIEDLTVAILNGHDVPPIDVRLDADGKIYVVDGHCRTRAYRAAKQRGADIVNVKARRFEGNDVDRLVKVVGSSQGMALSPLELGITFKRLVKYGWTSEKIATQFNKTRPYVDNLLLLANANNVVQQYVADGKISATNAVETVRKHGEKAGTVIENLVKKSESVGKRKVTAKVIDENAVPKKVAQTFVAEVETFYIDLPVATKSELEELVTKSEDELEGKVVEISAKDLVKLLKAIKGVDAARISAKVSEKAKETV